jgi:hypothetical protein
MGNGQYTRASGYLFAVLTHAQIDKRDDPYAPQQSNGCCIVM